MTSFPWQRVSAPVAARSLLVGLSLSVGLAGCWRDGWEDCESRCSNVSDKQARAQTQVSGDCDKQCHVLHSR
jgi:hypothetical protein